MAKEGGEEDWDGEVVFQFFLGRCCSPCSRGGSGQFSFAGLAFSCRRSFLCRGEGTDTDLDVVSKPAFEPGDLGRPGTRGRWDGRPPLQEARTGLGGMISILVAEFGEFAGAEE